MGYTHVNVTVKNPAAPERAWEGEFLVDTGAHDTFVPRRRLEAIGIEPLGSSLYELADGSIVEREVSGGLLEVMGRFGNCNVVFADDDTAPLLGVIALESLGAEVDPINERLRLIPARLALSPRRVAQPKRAADNNG
ncbi:MAG: aspartyl protease family protein [Acidimicrobiaceae bacterium]|nr:aspartyl protease family protein [Acidimicrobiaceae bacterium]MCY4174989.1 aspartyl protease family protein [Acidimicrobiaceae bacterium]MCY4280062.1 aspartyl protease family protein [Acidimicrobiaceae bacterium]MCY4293666.1 aspartyl protease family protein [Acidimicrobiaceae bacterium]